MFSLRSYLLAVIISIISLSCNKSSNSQNPLSNGDNNNQPQGQEDCSKVDSYIASISDSELSQKFVERKNLGDRCYEGELFYIQSESFGPQELLVFLKEKDKSSPTREVDEALALFFDQDITSATSQLLIKLISSCNSDSKYKCYKESYPIILKAVYEKDILSDLNASLEKSSSQYCSSYRLCLGTLWEKMITSTNFSSSHVSAIFSLIQDISKEQLRDSYLLYKIINDDLLGLFEDKRFSDKLDLAISRISEKRSTVDLATLDENSFSKLMTDIRQLYWTDAFPGSIPNSDDDVLYRKPSLNSISYLTKLDEYALAQDYLINISRVSQQTNIELHRKSTDSFEHNVISSVKIESIVGNFTDQRDINITVRVLENSVYTLISSPIASENYLLKFKLDDQNLTYKSKLSLDFQAAQLFLYSNNLGYISKQSGGLIIFDHSNLTDMTKLSDITDQQIKSIYEDATRNLLFTLTDTNPVEIKAYDISNPSSPSISKEISFNHSNFGKVHYHNGFLFYSSASRIYRWDLSDLDNIVSSETLIYSYSSFSIKDFSILDQYLVVLGDKKVIIHETSSTPSTLYKAFQFEADEIRTSNNKVLLKGEKVYNNITIWSPDKPNEMSHSFIEKINNTGRWSKELSSNIRVTFKGSYLSDLLIMTRDNSTSPWSIQFSSDLPSDKFTHTDFVQDMHLNGDDLYIIRTTLEISAGYESHIDHFKVTDTHNPIHVQTYNVTNRIRQSYIHENRLITSSITSKNEIEGDSVSTQIEAQDIRIVPLNDLSSTGISIPCKSKFFQVKDGNLFAQCDNRVEVYSLSNTPVLLASFNFEHKIGAIAASNERIFVNGYSTQWEKSSLNRISTAASRYLKLPQEQFPGLKVLEWKNNTLSNLVELDQTGCGHLVEEGQQLIVFNCAFDATKASLADEAPPTQWTPLLNYDFSDYLYKKIAPFSF